MAITRAPTGPDEDADEHQPQSQQPQPPQQQQPQSQPQQPHHPHALHQHSLSNASTATLDIESWTVHALESLSIAPIARGTGNALSIPLDGEHGTRGTPGNGTEAAAPAQMKLRGVTFGDATGASVTPPRRRPSRDSMRRREELHKGKEGSRQRRRWENAHLVHVPNVQPPLPTDWQIHPTHRVLPPVPYHLAHFWDKGPRELAEAPRRPHHNNPAGRVSEHAGHVPRDLRMAAKRIPAVKSFLRVLEEPVRQFVVERGLASTAAKGGGESSDETDPDDEEIVFVGRNGRMRDGKPWKSAQRQVAGGQTQERGLVLDAMDNDAGGAFKRWLTHSISDYYGLDSKSAMVGSPARRVIYVGVKPKQVGPRRKHPSRPVLPPPLWEMF